MPATDPAPNTRHAARRPANDGSGQADWPIQRRDRQLLEKPSIQTAILWELSHALERNFFADIAAQLPAHYASEALTAARAELELVKAERDVLARVLREG